MSVGLSAGLRCLEEEGRARSIPSAARPWRGGWGRAGGHRTLAGAGWEGWTRRCPGQRAGCHPANTGSKVTDQNTRQRYEGQGYIFIGGKASRRVPVWFMKQPTISTSKYCCHVLSLNHVTFVLQHPDSALITSLTFSFVSNFCLFFLSCTKCSPSSTSCFAL